MICIVVHTTSLPEYSIVSCDTSVGNFPVSSRYPAIANSMLLPYASTLLLSAEIRAFLIIYITNGVTINAIIAIITNTVISSINVNALLLLCFIYFTFFLIVHTLVT